MAPKKKKGGKGKNKAKKEEEEEEILMIKYYEIKQLRKHYLRQCQHFVTKANDQVLDKIERYHSLDYLSRENDFLDYLVINKCQMNCNDMYALSTSFQNFRYLKAFRLQDIQMDKGAFIALDKFLSRHKFIEYFEFTYCGGTTENSVYLASILRNSESLTDVIFDHNNLGSKGIINLFQGMKENENSKVRKLSLNFCNAHGSTLEPIIPLLSSNKTLTELYLHGNSLGQDGVMFIATALMNNNTLKILDLQSNNIIDDQEMYGRTLLTPIPSRSSLVGGPNAIGSGVASNISNIDINIPTTTSVEDAMNSSSDSGAVNTEDSNNSNNNNNNNSSNNNTNNNNNSNSNNNIDNNNNSISKSKSNSNSNIDIENQNLSVATSTLTYLADAVSREESAITHLNLDNNNIGNNGGEIMLEALKLRKAIVAAKKKTAPVFICKVTVRMKSDIYAKILEINKFMADQEKKRGGKKKGKKGKKK